MPRMRKKCTEKCVLEIFGLGGAFKVHASNSGQTLLCFYFFLSLVFRSSGVCLSI